MSPLNKFLQLPWKGDEFVTSGSALARGERPLSLCPRTDQNIAMEYSARKKGNVTGLVFDCPISYLYTWRLCVQCE